MLRTPSDARRDWLNTQVDRSSLPGASKNLLETKTTMTRFELEFPKSSTELLTPKFQAAPNLNFSLFSPSSGLQNSGVQNIAKESLVKGFEHAAIHTGIHALDKSVQGISHYLEPKVTMIEGAFDAHQRLNDSRYADQSSEKRFVCAGLGTGVKTLITVTGVSGVNIAAVATAPNSFGTSFLLRGAGYVGVEFVSSAAGDITQKACHKAFDVSSQLNKQLTKFNFKSLLKVEARTPEVQPLPSQSLPVQPIPAQEVQLQDSQSPQAKF